MGDPDGLIFRDGLYHLFWWGHAVSRDLVHWTELPFPLLGDDGTFNPYTGSVVDDKNNSAGFGADSLVAIYTMHGIKGGGESVGVSHSRNAVDFLYHAGNPVLDIGSTDFRDPTVFWHAPTHRWIMVIALPNQKKISFYSSTDLKSWRHESDFGGLGAQGTPWETPDLFQLPVDGGQAEKWVLSVSVGPNRVQYFTGDFDGARFTPDAKLKAFLQSGDGVSGTVFAGFDGATYGGWKTTGTAFGNGPSHAAQPAHLGAGQVDSFGGSDAATGTLSSPPFTIEKSAINFLIGGGNHPGKTCINLLVDGKTVRTATGDNTPSLKWRGWDVSDLRGQTATLQLVDNYTGSDYGHFNVDQILFSDELRDFGREHALWADYGSDFYAARIWRGTQKRTVWLGWMGNWDYANAVPTLWGKGFASLPRVLALKTFDGALRLTQTPIPELHQLRENPVAFSNRKIEEGTHALPQFAPTKNAYEIEAEFAASTRGIFGFNFCIGEGRKLALRYDARLATLSLDRRNVSDFSGNAIFAERFPQVSVVPLQARGGVIKLHVFVDQASIEVFAGEGETVLSSATFPAENQTGIEVVSEGGASTLASFKAWTLKSIWDKPPLAIPATLSPAQAQNHSAEKIAAGGFLDYQIKANYDGPYLVTARVAGSGKFHLEVDGKKVGETFVARGDAAPLKTTINLSLGAQTLRLRVEEGALSFPQIAIVGAENAIVSGGVYQLIARHSQRVLDAAGKQNGAKVQQWQPLNNDNQKWKIEAVASGFFKLTALNSGLALTASGNENGAPLTLQPWTNDAAQQWELLNIGGGYFSIRGKSSGKVLDVREFSKSNGGVVQLWQNLDGASQQWNLKRVEAAP